VHLVIAYDGSPGAAAAVRAVASLFPAAQVSVVTVPPQSRVPSGGVAALLPALSPAVVQQAIDELGAEADRQARTTAQQGVEQARALGLEAEIAPAPAREPAWATVLDSAQQLGADVVACGTRGRGAFARAVLGSTASSLLHHTTVPLLVVPDGGGQLHGPAFVAYDGSDGAKHAIRVAGRLLDGRATVVTHAWEPAGHRSLAPRALAAGVVDELQEVVQLLQRALADGAAATTQEGVDAACAAGLDAVGETIESTAGAWRTVAAAARTREAAVIVTGARGLGGARSVLLGSVSSGLVQNAELPILVVPASAPPA
jgi:nucleotide-binding universal stress UspA family protein